MLSGILNSVKGYSLELKTAWNTFWFTPSDPATLALLRILVGGMLFYTHLIWTMDLEAFFGPHAWISTNLAAELHADRPYAWSLFYHIDSPTLLWTVHSVALVVFALMTLGLFSRVTTVLAYLFAVSYANRITPGAFFGLDKINCLLAMYIMLGPSGARYSLDQVWKLRQGITNKVAKSVGVTIAIRLLQLHMCLFYLFAALGKVPGPTWWNGLAMWGGVGNLEYQSLDMTWLAAWPNLIAFMTYASLFWELFYPVLIWNRFARPVMLGMALLVHGGIALFMGMITFGFAMLFGNLAFISPESVRRWCDPFARRVSLALVGESVE